MKNSINMNKTKEKCHGSHTSRTDLRVPRGLKGESWRITLSCAPTHTDRKNNDICLKEACGHV